MPVFEYRCDGCGACFEMLVRRDSAVACPECGGTSIGQIKSRRLFQCRKKGCRKQFSVKVGTIFESSPLGLDKWLVGIWMIVNCRNGVSSCEIARTLGDRRLCFPSCHVDDVVFPAIAPQIGFEYSRASTLGQGAPRCEFRFRRTQNRKQNVLDVSSPADYARTRSTH